MSNKLVIAEKPSVAKSYAEALNIKTRQDGYYEGQGYIITWAFGHLLTLRDAEDYDAKYKRWALETLPIIPERFRLKLIENAGAKKQFAIIKNLIEREDVDGIIIGTDAGREGELIARYILLYAKNRKPLYRLWLSSQTKNDIIKGFKNIEPASKYDTIFFSAQARSELDWILGINFSRAYTVKKGRKVLLSVGRCQTPVLALICKRDTEVKNFKPTPYFEVTAGFSEGYSGKWTKDNHSRIEALPEAEKIKSEVEGRDGLIESVKKEIKRAKHPYLFNLTNLQRTLNRKYGYTAQDVLDTAQGLYEKHKILSYPRTASRHISQSMVNDLPSIIKNLSFGKFKPFADYCLGLGKLPVTKRLADDSMVTDHTALVPTDNGSVQGIYAKLSQKEKHVFDEVVLVFLAAFFGDYVYERTVVTTKVEGHSFLTRGIREIEKGWRAVYEERVKTAEGAGANTSDDAEEEEGAVLPELREGQRVKCEKADIESKKTQAPKAFTENSLLQVMENPTGLVEEEGLKKAIKGHGIGTDATRAAIIETLIKRGYIERDKKNLVPTQLGHQLIQSIDLEYLKSPELTARWEYNLERIAAGEILKREFMGETIDVIKDGLKKVIQDKSTQVIEKPVGDAALGKCPLCKIGDIISGSKGYGCARWKDGCKFVIWKEIAGKKISEAQVKKLLKKGSTDVLKGFKGKNDKKFDAALKLDEGCKVVFDFSDKSSK